MDWFRRIDGTAIRRNSRAIFSRLIRTRDPNTGDGDETTLPTRQRLSRCLRTADLTSLGVGSCVGTGMYLVTGMVAHKVAGPAVTLSFIIAALASIFSGACYAEFGVRVPNTSGSAYTYAYVTCGELVAFIVGWNMILEYIIGTSACARAISASVDALFNGAISKYFTENVGTVFGQPPDFVAFGISILMTLILLAGVKKSLFFTNLLNAINVIVWVFIVGAGVFYVDTDNWTKYDGFLPFGWTGVFSGAASCFYAFIGFDIIATAGLEAIHPERSIPLAIASSLTIILFANVTSSVMLTLIVPYSNLDPESALVQMFGYVHAPTCKFIVAVGALSGLTVSMFGSMFPLPRVILAMAQDGLIFRPLGRVSEFTRTPALATITGGIFTSLASLFVSLEVLVAIMSIGTLLAYTLVSTCILILRYQPNINNLIELLPHRLRTPLESITTTFFGRGTTHMMPAGQQVMVRRVTRSSPDSDDSVQDSEEDEHEEAYLVNTDNENNFYRARRFSVGSTRWSRYLASFYRWLQSVSYLCPGVFPWVDCGPATDASGMFVIKAVGIMFVLIVIFDICAAYASPSESTFDAVVMVLIFIAIVLILLAISRKPENRASLSYATPYLPLVPTIAIMVNIYLILNLSILTLLRFTVWMTIGLVVYFKYGIKNSTLEMNTLRPRPTTPPTPSPFDLTILLPATQPPPATQPLPIGDRNIFEGDGLYSSHDYSDPLRSRGVGDLETVPLTTSNEFAQVETRYNERSNSTTSHASTRPPWAYPDVSYDEWLN